ncbi:unnamed protein product [Prunus armeniaca]|uniref:Uncharacterized protein n=1 Tax=Prunus armeniaca TaxID=36596 RepID=A0A6J5U1R8_PRUAR|nr:unnamed protein product [Prunus armeniaca]
MILKLAIDKDWTSIGIVTIAINLAPDLQVAISKQHRTASEKHVHEIIIVASRVSALGSKESFTIINMKIGSNSLY